MSQQLNYHHLWHFYCVAREEGLRAAADQLMISPSTLSEQVKSLEQQFGGKLFLRQGRSIRLSDLGRHVYEYASQIFRTGNELIDSIRHGNIDLRVPLRVGVVNAMPKVVAYHLLAPLFNTDPVIELSVAEDEMHHLLAKLANDEMDVLLSDSPVPPHSAMNAYNHLLGDSDLGIFINKRYTRTIKKHAFPDCLNNINFLMPSANTVLSRELERWFEQNDVQPTLQARFENSSLLKFFASRGHGAFAAPIIAREYIESNYNCSLLGSIPKVKEQYYAITSDRRIKHPAVLLIQETAEDFMLKNHSAFTMADKQPLHHLPQT